jgi:DNA-formamidopyrimidine glycosylase
VKPVLACCTLGVVPELPEVEALAGFLTERAVGRVVARVDIGAISVLKTYDPPVTSLQGLEITGAQRWGKFLDVDVSGLHLITHLARGGWLRWRDELPKAPLRPGKSPLAARVHLDDGSGWDLTEMGTQKRLAVYVVKSPYDVPGIARLGPDPLDPAFDVAALASLLSGTRMQLKGLLRDQSVLAGVGNAYSDEVLHVARLSPFKISTSLTEGEVETLYAALQSTLRDAVRRSVGLGAADLKAEKKVAMRVHGRTGQACPVCGDTVREVSFADSSLQYCPTCQTGGKPLADRRLSRLLK